MERLPFIFTVCFVLLGPVKLIPAFARTAAGLAPSAARRVAWAAALVAALVCLLVGLLGRSLVTKYRLSLEALELGGGLVLLLSALRTIFPRAEPSASAPAPPATAPPAPLQAAIAVATPGIVAPAGVAAILIFVMQGPALPGVARALALALAVILALDLLVMRFNAAILRVPGLLPVLQVAGQVLVFIQVALACETMLHALRSLGVVEG